MADPTKTIPVRRARGVMRHRIGVLMLSPLVLAGCWGRTEPAATAPKQPFRGVKVVAGVVGAKALVPGLDAQRGEWAAETGADLTVRDVPAEVESLKAVDVLVFPGDRLGDLIDGGLLQPLPEAALVPPAPARDQEATSEGARPSPPPDPFAFPDVAAAYREEVTKYGKDRYALPLGGTALVLAFRRDAFDRPENKAAAKTAGIELAPPKTWSDLDALAKFFHGRDWDGDGKPDSGIALAWGADPEGVGDSTFLARAASLGQHRDQYSFLFDTDRMEPRVASPPFVEALQGLIDLTNAAPPGAAQFDADAARSAFRSGKVALLIDRAERASTWSEGKPVGVAPLPGSPRVYNPRPEGHLGGRREPQHRPSYLPLGGGWLVGVVASSPHRDAAVDLAKYISGPDVTNRLRADRAFPMLATRTSQLGTGLPDAKSAPGVGSPGAGPTPSEADDPGRPRRRRRTPRPGGRGVSRRPDEGPGGRGRGEAGGGGALKGVADAWEARTKSLGPRHQVWHYRRSLVRLVTTPEPPPRGE